MNNYEIWMEGYSCTENYSGARYEGKFEADTFREACNLWAETLDSADRRFYNKDHLTFWGCKLFDNEADARRAFG